MRPMSFAQLLDWTMTEHKKSGTVWAGLFNRGLAYYHSSMSNFTLYNKKNIVGNWGSDDVLCMLEADDSSIFLGTSAGLYRLSADRTSVSCPFKELSRGLFRTAYKELKGRMWFGTYMDGLYCIDKGKISHYLFPLWNCTGNAHCSQNHQ